MPGCNECKFYKSELDYNEDFSRSFKRSCLLGNTNEMLTWWEESGKKFSNDTFDELPCHEHHESTKSLIEMNRLYKHFVC